MLKYKLKQGFTLIELSIALVIIGLLVGGVLVGKDLIVASEVRAQISQIREFNVAVRTFQNKYKCLPGDCNKAASFGFFSRSGEAGRGDGNGLIEGNLGSGGSYNSGAEAFDGEPALFWVDLSTSKLIANNFTGAVTCADPNNILGGCENPFSSIVPPAKLGGGGYVYTWSGGWGRDEGNGTGSGSSGVDIDNVPSNGINYFALAAVDMINGPYLWSHSGLRVDQAFAIDSKIDDGLPQAGKVTAMYASSITMHVYGGSVQYAAGGQAPFDFAAQMGGDAAQAPLGATGTAATAATATTCFDNGNVAGATQRYSMSQNKGAGINCALSFQFQ